MIELATKTMTAERRIGSQSVDKPVMETSLNSLLIQIGTTGSDILLYTKNSVASPRKMKKPPESVTAVIMTDDPTAGSRPSLIIVIGISTPISAASSRFNVIASTITSPSEICL